MDKGQTNRFSKGDIFLFKKTFGGEDSPVLYALRNLLWQFELTAEDRKHLDFKGDVLELLKKSILPTNNSDVPISPVSNQQNVWMNLAYVKDFSPQGANYHFQAHDILMQYLKQQFHQLVTGTEPKSRKIVLEDLPTETGGLEETRFVNMMAYHKICQYLTGRINEIQTFANYPEEETEEQKKTKEKKNSTQ